MAIEACLECGKEISTRAKVCPNCGIEKPFQKEFERGLETTRKGLTTVSNKLFKVGCFFVILVFLLVLFMELL